MKKFIAIFVGALIFCQACNHLQGPHRGKFISKTEKEYSIIDSGCYRSCWTSIIDMENGESGFAESGSVCIGRYTKGRKVKGYEYKYELQNHENKKIGEVTKIILFREEDCK